MRKTKLLLDPPAECEQFGLLPRGGDDLHAEWLLILMSRRRHCEDREADERDDEGDGQIVDRRFKVHIVNPRRLARVIVPGKNRSGRRDKEILVREQVPKI